MTEKIVKMAAKLYECRIIARSLLGPKFRDYMDTFGYAITTIAKQQSISEIGAAIDLSKRAANEFEVIYILAAAVELAEPSA